MSSNSSQADSAGSIPVTRSTREKCCSTSESDWISQAGQRSFASENGTRAITRALSHLGECPWRLLVPKLTVRLQLPPPAPRAKSVTRMCGCSGEEFPYCVKAAGFASRRGGLRAGMRLRPVPPSATSTKRRDELDPDQNAERPQTMAWRLTPWQFRPYQRSSSTRAKYHNGPDSASCLPWVRILPPAMLLPSVSQWVTGRAVGLPK